MLEIILNNRCLEVLLTIYPSKYSLGIEKALIHVEHTSFVHTTS